jgi:phage baseplate assembly protein W
MAINQSTPRRLQANPGYSDVTTNLTAHPLKRDLSLLTNEDAVKRSVKNILLTSKGERRLDPQFGAGLNRYLFEQLTASTVQTIKNDILHSIQTYEPRAVINSVDISAHGVENTLHVTVTFTTRNTTEPQRLEVVLDRIR